MPAVQRLIGDIDRFVVYTGFVRRDSIARLADAEITSFEELATMVRS